jgi:two-component system, sensor histidine kinase FlrB
MTAAIHATSALAASAAPPSAEALLAAVPAAVVVTDGHGGSSARNAAARALLAQADPALTAALAAPAGSHTTRSDATSEVALRSGARLRLARRPLPAGGEVVLITDVTGERGLDEALTRHRRLAALGELAATLAHQIRTPLAAAVLYVGNATLPGLAGDQRSSLLDRATACLRDLEQLVDGMLGFARGAARAPVATTIRDVLATVERAAAAACRPGQTLRIATAPPAIAVPVGREALAGALLNLVQNALQAAGADAVVSIDIDADQARVRLTVADNGPGIPPALRLQVRQPFFTTRPDGNGLGLAVVDALVRAAGGTLTIADRPLAGKAAGSRPGVAICLELPRAAAPAIAPEAPLP